MKKQLLILLSFLACAAVFAQPKKVKTAWRLDYYMNEPTAQYLVYLPDSTVWDASTITLTSAKGEQYSSQCIKGEINSITVPIDGLGKGKYPFSVVVKSKDRTYQTSDTLVKMPYKFNATQIDRKTASVISRGMPVIPFGFYCYSPVQSTIAEEEVVSGFNLMSPYQNIPRTKIGMRKVYMDRAAELGMRVNYNLLSVATGGTGYNKNQKAEERLSMLRAEVEAFKDHPALISWYLADEPDGRKTPPQDIISLYREIKKIDPYHPVTIVFMHRGTARKYAEGLDIAMGDLYPVPRAPLSGVYTFQKELSDEFFLEKAIWLVPQAFGGNEWWQREPTAQEMRAATYMGLLGGSHGFQYFIRHGQNGFPKSTTAWAEAGAMALEIAEMTPYILSGEKAPDVTISDSMCVSSAFSRGKNLIIVAVNKENKPKDFSIFVKDYGYSGVVTLPFENRKVEMQNGVITDKMLGYDTKVYKLTMDETLMPRIDTSNAVVDGDFERNTSVGVPDAVYAQVGAGRGSTYFLDSRTAHSGEHSMRLNTYANGTGVTLQHFPMIVPSGKTYTVSFWAKCADEKEFPLRKNVVNARGKVKTQKLKAQTPTLHVNLRHLGKALVDTDIEITNPEWTLYTVDVPVDKQPGQGRDGITLNITLKNRSCIWIDDVSFKAKE
ncbi:MAG: glycoside hydrolase family 2 TIM barrel-domain containing protein [Flavobacteriales bacterium]|nr:glycoside hydrolase family 2 TIM barrel-domain containing protein [Flavobacteriales bacterium]